jgi:FkbM family methyltransferase
MKSLNVLSDNELFKKTELGNAFRKAPLGFIDAGAAGGVHPLVMPAAALVHCTCFEPDPDAHAKLLRHAEANGLFAKLSLSDRALGEKAGEATLYLTESPVNSSLLRPSRMLVDRYGTKGFALAKEIHVQTASLDDIVSAGAAEGDRAGEFIKLDCQGAEYDILQGGTRTLEEQCVALWCEVEFFPMYEKQKTFSELDLFLRDKGFLLYGLYPNYISAKKLDRRASDTEERIIWADALYFKDPLAEANRKRSFSEREIQALLLTAILTGFNDYALELVAAYYPAGEENTNLVRLINDWAAVRQEDFMTDWRGLLADCRRAPQNAYLLARRFVDRHASNSNIDFIKIVDQPREKRKGKR